MISTNYYKKNWTFFYRYFLIRNFRERDELLTKKKYQRIYKFFFDVFYFGNRWCMKHQYNIFFILFNFWICQQMIYTSFSAFSKKNFFTNLFSRDIKIHILSNDVHHPINKWLIFFFSYKFNRQMMSMINVSKKCLNFFFLKLSRIMIQVKNKSDFLDESSEMVITLIRWLSVSNISKNV